MWVRCPRCDVAFQVNDGGPQTEVRCDACGTRLGVVADAEARVDRPLSIPHAATLTGHARDVWSVAFALDGNSLASGSLDGTVRLWDPAAGKVQTTLQGHTGGVLAVAFSPDGRTLASGSRDGTVRLWDLPAGTARVTLPGYTGASVAFSPNGTLVATGGVDDTVRLWEVASGRSLPTLKAGRNSVHAIAFSPDGATIALGHAVGSGVTLQLWDLAANVVRASLPGHQDVTSVCFSADGQVLASADLHGLVKLWDPSTGAERAALTPAGRNQYFQPSAVLSVAFSPRGSFLVAGLHLQAGPNVQIWEVATGQVRAVLEGHRNSVQSVTFSPDGRTLATGSRDRTIRLWSLSVPN